MRILVTGAGGYIGAVLVPQLLDRGHEVIGIDSFMRSQTSLLDCCYQGKLTVVRGDIRDRDLISKYIKRVDAIFALAALPGAPLCANDPIAARTINLESISMLLELRGRDQAIFFPNTNSGYRTERSGEYCTEETPMTPASLYGRLKLEAEKMLLGAGNCVTLRLASAFGVSPCMRLDLLVNDFAYRAVTDHFLVLFEAHFKRNFIHVRDVAKAFIHCLDNFDTMRNEPYNVGLSDANLTKWELCEEIKRQVPDFYFVEADIGQDPDKRDYLVSNAKIEGTGYKPDISLQAGIAELIKAFQIIGGRQF